MMRSIKIKDKRTGELIFAIKRLPKTGEYVLRYPAYLDLDIDIRDADNKKVMIKQE